MDVDQKKNLHDLLKAGGYNAENESEYAANLSKISKEVQRRVCALKKNQLESINVESEFFLRVHELELEFQSKFAVVHAKRNAIVSGEHEPTDAECDIAIVHGLEADELQKLKDEAPIEGGVPSKGIPDFWFHVLHNSQHVSETIREYDEPILKSLVDITCEMHNDPTAFTLLFHFAENPYFSNSVLKKYYEMKIVPDTDAPFDFEGPTIVSSHGDEIQWKEGKNVTQKIVKKKQKKGTGAGRFITKTVSNDSFFNFFDPTPKVLSQDMDPELEEKIRDDFELGQLIRDHIIPRAVLFFTGEASDEDFDDEFDEGEDGDDDDSDDNEEED